MKTATSLLKLIGICIFFFLIAILKPTKSDLSEEEQALISNALSVLSSEEKKSLEYVFEHLFFFDQFSYPIFGRKPMSIGRLIPTNKTRLGWNAWKKIAPSFRSNKLVIRESIFNGHDLALVANLDEVKKIYNENKELFDKSFSGRITLETLNACIKEEGPLFQELMHNHLCLGLLLGYGKRNAEIFSNNQNFSVKERIPLESFSSGHPIFYYFSSVMPVYFACDPNSIETKELKNQYAEERAAIVKMSKKDTLFNRMLVLLKSGR